MKKFFKLAAVSGVAFSILAFSPSIKLPSPFSSVSYASEKENQKIKGTIEAVDMNNYLLTVNGKQYTMTQNVKIGKEESDEKIPLSDISKYVGTRTELKLNKDGSVYGIELGED